MESELYKEIFGERDRKAGKNKKERGMTRRRKYGASAMATHVIGPQAGIVVDEDDDNFEAILSRSKNHSGSAKGRRRENGVNGRRVR